MVIGIGKDNITTICELEAGDIKTAAGQPDKAPEVFRSVLEKARQRLSK